MISLSTGHCHQKALYGTQGNEDYFFQNASIWLRVPSGCCGMAGSFGYETEHYDLSKKIGEGIFVSAVKSMKEGTTLVANGFSCRGPDRTFYRRET